MDSVAAVTLMTEYGFHYLPVVDDERRHLRVALEEDAHAAGHAARIEPRRVERPIERFAHGARRRGIFAYQGERRLMHRITIAGDTMALHFDSPKQARAGFNMVYTALLSTVYYAVKTVVDPTIPPNSGLSRPLTVTAPVT